MKKTPFAILPHAWLVRSVDWDDALVTCNGRFYFMYVNRHLYLCTVVEFERVLLHRRLLIMDVKEQYKLEQ